MHLTGLDLLFWAAGFFAHATLLAVLWIRQRIRAFPIFTALITLNVLRTIALFCLQRYGSKSSYFYTYWSLAILDVAIQLGVVYEMASRVFRPLGKWAIDTRRGLIWWFGGSIIVAATLTSISTPPAQLWMQVVIIKGSFFSAALLSQLFVGMIVLSVTMGLPWKSQVARISQGLGFYSLATVLIEAAIAYFGFESGTEIYERLYNLRMAIYLTCVVFWIVMLWRRERPTRTMTDRMRREVSVVHGAATRHAAVLRSRRNP
jgi:hypothetical protein